MAKALPVNEAGEAECGWGHGGLVVVQCLHVLISFISLIQ